MEFRWNKNIVDVLEHNYEVVTKGLSSFCFMFKKKKIHG
jgi:hypothetical protein